VKILKRSAGNSRKMENEQQMAYLLEMVFENRSFRFWKHW
jgi:hypothetical protein